jgi:hypothetical protein
VLTRFSLSFSFRKSLQTLTITTPLQGIKPASSQRDSLPCRSDPGISANQRARTSFNAKTDRGEHVMVIAKMVSGALALGMLGWSGVQAEKLLKGGRGDDVLIANAISGEPAIAQDYEAAGTGATGPNGETLRGDDPDDPVLGATRTYFAGQSYDDHLVTMIGGKGADQFVIRTFLSGKPDVVARHVNDDDTINWGDVAGENTYVHDHWTEYFGDVQINDFDAGEGDTLQVRGHTVSLNSLEVIDGNTVIVVQSQQGNGGGAHDEDLLGVIIVKDAELTEDDVEFTSTNDGIVATMTEFIALVEYYDEVAAGLRGNNLIVKRRGNNVPMGPYNFPE